MNLVSIYAGHDANVTFYNSENDSYHTIELERLVRKRYFRLHHDNDAATVQNLLNECQNIASKFWGIKNEYEAALVIADGWIHPPDLVGRVFNTKKVLRLGMHHQSHAASTFWQSPYTDSIVISYDGGGNDGFFSIHRCNKDGINLLEKIQSDFGGSYLLCASLTKEVCESSRAQLSLPGKLMGLCGYGKPKLEWIDNFSQFFFDKNYQKLSSDLGLNLKNTDDPWKNPMSNWRFEGQESYDIAATAQKGFEEAFFSVLKRIVKTHPDVPICITGGCALNVLVNERVKNELGLDLYVPPNPNDCGLSLGGLFLYKPPNRQVDVTYNGLPLLDKEDLDRHIKERSATKTSKKEIAQLLKSGNIVGLVYGDSEVGPRALGNRSIVCDPSYPNMKDILNKKVKFREWYRPFAPFCKKEEAHKWFDSINFNNLEYMSYAPLVKEEFRDVLPSITHVDGTARLQGVTKESHEGFYDLLTEFGKVSDTNVLLNTSFNIRGRPILSTVADALYVLDNTEMDYVVIEDYLFSKKNEKDE